MNHSARHAQLYRIISPLHDKDRLVDVQVKLVSEGRLRQDHIRKAKSPAIGKIMLPKKEMPQACWEHALLLMDHIMM